jgi:hypothetical protein
MSKQFSYKKVAVVGRYEKPQNVAVPAVSHEAYSPIAENT